MNPWVRRGVALLLAVVVFATSLILSRISGADDPPELHGTVTDRNTGAPLAGVTVTTNPHGGARAITDVNGGYALTAAQVGMASGMLYLSKRGYYQGQTPFTTLESAAVVNATLRHGGTIIKGSVIDANTQAGIVGARLAIVAQCIGANGAPTNCGSCAEALEGSPATTTAGGAYVFDASCFTEAAATGALTINAESVSAAAYAPYSISEPTYVPPPYPATQNFSLVLDSGAAAASTTEGRAGTAGTEEAASTGAAAGNLRGQIAIAAQIGSAAGAASAAPSPVRSPATPAAVARPNTVPTYSLAPTVAALGNPQSSSPATPAAVARPNTVPTYSLAPTVAALGNPQSSSPATPAAVARANTVPTYSLSPTVAALGNPQSSSPATPAAVARANTVPTYSLSPTVAAFGNQQINLASAPLVLTLTNTGTVTLPITSITLSGANALQFSQTNTCGAALAAAATCTIGVVFAPTSIGLKTTTLNVNAGGGAGKQTVAVSGTGIVATYTVSPTSLAFGNVQTNTASAPQALTLTNTGAFSLPITSVTLTGANALQFSQTNTCGTAVAAGANCTINVVFTPTSIGPKAPTLNINAGDGAGKQTVALSGTGVVASDTVSPPSLAFGAVQIDAASAPQVLTLTNTGAVTLPITSITLTGANASQFSQTNTCAASVAAGANCAINVVLTPTSTGSKAATLNVTAGGGAGKHAVALTGTGLALPYSVAPAAADFGGVQTGVASAPQLLTLTNTGTLPLPVTSLTVAGTNAAEFTETDDCTPSVAVGAACTISVVFTPTLAGSASATLSVNSSTGTLAVALNGTGLVVQSSGPQLLQYQTYQTQGSAGENDSAVQFGSMTTAGDTIWVAVTLSDYAGVHTISVTDTQGNVYQELDQENDKKPGYQTVAHFYAANIVGDTTTPDTVTIVWTNENYKGVLITEISGTTGAPLVGHSGNIQDKLAAGSNNITSGGIAVGSGQTLGLLLALSMNTTGGSSDLGGSGYGGPSVGSGFTSVATLWNWGVDVATLETEPVTAVGSVAGLFNALDTDSYVTVAAVFQ